MKKNPRTLIVEAPDAAATVDFLTDGCSVELEIKDGKLRVCAKMPYGEDASSWDEHEVEWDFPEES